MVEGDNWYSSNAKYGNYICTPCAKVYANQYYREHREERAAYKHQYYREYRDEALAYARQYYQEHREERLAYDRQYYEEHQDEKRAYARQYHWENREERLAYRRKYYQEHQDEARAYKCQWHEENPDYNRKYYEEHRERIAAYNCQWRKENPDKVGAQSRLYQARKRGAPTVEKVDEQKVYDFYNNTCIYCGGKKGLELDHVVPLSGGGAHTEDNLVVACRSCNASKGAKSLLSWARSQPWSGLWMF